MSDKSYDVGFGKPPKNSRFKPGQSGNPKGRPKGAKGLRTELKEELSERISVTEGGSVRRVSKLRAMLKAMTAKALKGDARAANVMLNLVQSVLEDEPNEQDVKPLTKADADILAEFERELLGNAKNVQEKDD
tara:strand:- start:4478 stop:4876 length:399 start_codon:yes stop_codon:yes gene_type:complete